MTTKTLTKALQAILKMRAPWRRNRAVKALVEALKKPEKEDTLRPIPMASIQARWNNLNDPAYLRNPKYKDLIKPGLEPP